MKKFEVLDISGDAGLRIWGKDLAELFSNAAEGMYDLITNVEEIREEKSIPVSLQKDTFEGLFVAWLNELIFSFDAYGFVGRKAIIKRIGMPSSDKEESVYLLDALVYGEEFDAGRHQSGLLIKAATYHTLRIEKKADGWEAEVMFDI